MRISFSKRPHDKTIEGGRLRELLAVPLKC